MEYKEIIKSAEIWKDIEGTNGKYIVSNDGKVATLRKRKKLLTLTKQKTGYLYAMIEINGKQVNKRVNRLVASAFVNNPDNLPIVNHLDGCKTNNHAENLQWVSYKANTKHAWEKGLAKTRIPDADERKRISEKLKGHKVSEETRKKMSLAQKGKKRPKLSEKLKGRKLSEETKRKLSLAHKGKKLSKEHIEAIRLARWGNGKKS
jgi:hypothetical protein